MNYKLNNEETTLLAGHQLLNYITKKKLIKEKNLKKKLYKLGFPINPENVVNFLQALNFCIFSISEATGFMLSV